MCSNNVGFEDEPIMTLHVCGVFGRCLESHWFVWVSQSNHLPMTIEHDRQVTWLEMQLSATCNVEKSLFNDWFTGHLNFQIEHQ